MENPELTFETLSRDVNPVYRSFEGWQTTLNGLTNFGVLPAKLSEYIRFIEKTVKLPIEILSAGPGREQTIMR